MGDSIKQRRATRTFLGRLARDVRGNTLAIMAAAMIPVLGFAGSAIDTARLYVVKVRLQQACDAGVLAGRRTMTDTTTTTPLEDLAAKQAKDFFDNNFKNNGKTGAPGWYQTSAVDFTPTKTKDTPSSTAANAVTGVATATVPMAVMQFFGIKPVKINVSCEAHYDIADTDIMFVLDTTGSMSCTPSDPPGCANSPVVQYAHEDGTIGYSQTEKSDSKIEALRKAVILFDSTIRANADPTSHFRYGFVTYTAAVNIGKIIPPEYLQNTTWQYQSRRVKGDYNYSSQIGTATLPFVKADCVDQRFPATGYALSKSGYWTDEGYAQARNYTSMAWSNSKCTGKAQRVRPVWRYEQVKNVDISNYITGAETLNPSRVDGSKSKWRGCVEELDTDNASSFDLDSLPPDLNPDVHPTDANNKWRPIWPEVEWQRSTAKPAGVDINDDKVNENDNYGTKALAGAAPCGAAARRLGTMTADEVHDYVYGADFKPYGGTYHDVGMIWGTRMLSPDGIFGQYTAAWPGRTDPTRSIVFMTDGNMAPTMDAYGQYGYEQFDKRIGSSSPSQTARHNARFRIECDAAKKKGMTIYVVALGININDDLTYCASPGQAFEASSTDELKEAFADIAKRVAMLRITK